MLDRISARTGDAPKVLLRDDDGPDEAPMIDAASGAALRPNDGSPHYQVLGKIAEGGMGAVFKSHDRDLGRDVAMKVLLEKHAEQPAILQRFIEEAQIGGQLQHPGIVPVYELGLMEDQRPFFTMKLVKGRTLAALLAERRGDVGERRRFIKIFEQVCETMAYAHSRRVVHRDLKPANIMVGAFGEVQVVDWGLGKVLTEGGVADERAAVQALNDVSIIETLRSTGSSMSGDSLVGSVMGTPMYMSPEQARGDVDRLDERTDVFGLGAILCEMLTGKPPYIGAHDAVLKEAARAMQDGARERLAACGADPFLVEFVERCLAPNPAVRPRSASALVEELGGWLADQEQRARDAEVAQVRAEQERRARRLTLALASTIVVALAAGSWFWQSQQDAAAARREVLQSDVDGLIAEAQLARGGGDLTAALARTEAAGLLVVASPDADDALSARVTALSTALTTELASADAEAAREKHVAAFVAALEAALGATNLDGGAGFNTRLLALLDNVFADIGIDPDGDPESQALILRELGRDELIGQAIDQWARCALQVHGFGEQFVQHIELAQLVDADPSRQIVRAALLADDRQAILELAESPEAHATWTPITAMTFHDSVRALGHRDIELRPMLRSVSRRHPSDALLHGKIAIIDIWLASAEDQDRVRGLHHAAIQYAAFPDGLAAMQQMARAQAMNGMGEEAIELAVRAIQTHPEAYLAQWERGGTFIAHMLPKNTLRRERLRIYEAHGAIHPDDPALLSEWGWEMLNAPDPSRSEIEQGREHALRAMQLTEETSDNWNTVGVASWMLGDLDSASSAAERSIELGGGYSSDHAVLAWVHATEGREAQARAAVRAMELGPDVALDVIEQRVIAEAQALFDDD